MRLEACQLDQINYFMTDIIDLAQKFQAINMAQSMLAHAASAKCYVRPKPVGHCLNSDCMEPFEPNSARLFCGPSCAVTYDAQLKHKR